MNQRYRLQEGIVIRRTPLPNGDVVVTLLSEAGKWRAVVRKGKHLGGNLARLSLFHDVTAQVYQKRDDDLSVMTQVQLNGALPNLTSPAVYPYAHLLAELVDKLTAESHQEEGLYSYLVSGLRGLSRHPDPEQVALIITWKLLQQAGLAPRLKRCARCGQADVADTFDVAAGGLTCATCRSGMRLEPRVQKGLIALLQGTVRQALVVPLEARETHWTLLLRYVSYHVGSVTSLGALVHTTDLNTNPDTESTVPAVTPRAAGV